jgi:hypothetical protein
VLRVDQWAELVSSAQSNGEAELRPNDRDVVATRASLPIATRAPLRKSLSRTYPNLSNA